MTAKGAGESVAMALCEGMSIQGASIQGASIQGVSIYSVNCIHVRTSPPTIEANVYGGSKAYSCECPDNADSNHVSFGR